MGRVDKIVVMGGGTAGFMAAVTLKAKVPGVRVVVLRSKEIGIIGVGEGSGPPLGVFLHTFLGLPFVDFVRATRPGIKLGTWFRWGPRDHFVFPFGTNMEYRVDRMPRAVGYYCDREMDQSMPTAAMMAANRVFLRKPDGTPDLAGSAFAYHVENGRFVAYLEAVAARVGVEVREGTVRHVHRDDHGVTGLELASGGTEAGDLYVDCSGFGSELLGKAMGEPFVDYGSTLVCDRAVVGGWDRPAGDPILGYTTSDTMTAGWSWRIDHPDRVNRGYVYSSAFASDEAAERELRAANPRLTGPTRVVRFTSGRRGRSWAGNVVAIGNASGFVEPLEATSLVVIATRCQLLAELLVETDREATAAAAALFNNNTARVWDSIRRFLALHYRFNTRLQTPFWQHCRAAVDLAGGEAVVDYYRDVGPSPYLTPALFDPFDVFGPRGTLAVLVGLNVPTRRPYRPGEQEWAVWHEWTRHNAARAATGMTVEELLRRVGVAA